MTMTEPPTAPILSAADDSPPARPVPRWAIHRRLYDWTLGLAHRPHGTLALFLISFAESSFFPVPPDVLQIALSLERRSRAFWYALVSTIGSVLGGIFGYAIGWGLWHLVRGFFFRFIFSEETFNLVVRKYEENAAEVIFGAAFTPIPYKIFTVAAGVCSISLTVLIVASIVGRGLRFFIVATLIWAFGPPIRRFIDRYFNLLCLVLGALAIGGFVALKFLK